MSQGLDANVKSMTQAEKTMLRYQYVMSRTQNIQGDFLRTSSSWANVTRVIVQNLQNLGSTIGQITINAFKPFLIAVNKAILKLNDFAVMIENSLGKIFGWKFEKNLGGVISEMAEDAEDLSNGIEDSNENAKKLKNNLLGIDELNIVSQDENDKKPTDKGGTTSGVGNIDDSFANNIERIPSAFESSLDTLYKLGDAISERLIKSMESIKWDDIYEKARGFGSGLASFLNGLFADQKGITLFGEVGKTIASALNTVIYASLSFTDTFDFTQFGKNLADGINNFFRTFDFKALAEAINGWVDGIRDTIKGFFKNLDWEDILSGIGDFLSTLDADTIMLFIGIGSLKIFGKNIAKAIKDKVLEGLAKELAGSGLTVGAGIGGGLLLGLELLLTFKLLKEDVTNWVDNIKEYGWDEGRKKTAKEKGDANPYLSGRTFDLTVLKNWQKKNKKARDDEKKEFDKWADNVNEKISSSFEQIKENISKSFDDAKIATDSFKKTAEKLSKTLKEKNFKLEVKKKYEDAKEGLSEWYDKIKEKWGVKKLEVLKSFQDATEGLSTWYENIKSKWGTKKLELKKSFDGAKEGLNDWWIAIQSKWGVKKLEVKKKFESAKEGLSAWWKEIKDKWSEKRLWIGKKFQDAKTGLGSWWKEIKDNWGEKKLNIGKALQDAKTGLSDWWGAIKSFWGEKALSLKIALGDGITSALNGLIGSINSVINAWNGNKALVKIHRFEPLPAFQGFANGGYPDKGSLFWAGENGTPELMGTVGGRTAVASGNEITGIADAVYSTSSEEVALLRQQNQLLTQLLAKDTSVNIGDREIARANQRGQRAMGMTLRTT